MSHSPNRVRKPDPADQSFVAGLVAAVGITHAAKRVGLSRLALLNVMCSGDCYGSTLDTVRAARLAKV